MTSRDIRTALERPGDLDSAGAAAFVGRAGVRVVTDTEGRPRGEELFTGETPDAGGHDETGGTTSITLSTDALTRRAAGRRSVDDLTFSVAGDESVARRVLDHLVITP